MLISPDFHAFCFIIPCHLLRFVKHWNGTLLKGNDCNYLPSLPIIHARKRRFHSCAYNFAKEKINKNKRENMKKFICVSVLRNEFVLITRKLLWWRRNFYLSTRTRGTSNGFFESLSLKSFGFAATKMYSLWRLNWSIKTKTLYAFRSGRIFICINKHLWRQSAQTSIQ